MVVVVVVEAKLARFTDALGVEALEGLAAGEEAALGWSILAVISRSD